MKKRGKAISVVFASAVLLILVACNPEPDVKARKNTPVAGVAASQAPAKSGEELFKQFCATCHPDGGNASDPQRNLRRATLRANHITRPEDIIRIMRHPISRMITFDQSTISDRDARAIAEYVLSAF